MDSLWRSLGHRLAALPDDYDLSAVDERVNETINAAWELARHDVQRQLGAILSPVQWGMLSGWAKILYSATAPVHFRVFISGP